MQHAIPLGVSILHKYGKEYTLIKHERALKTITWWYTGRDGMVYTVIDLYAGMLEKRKITCY